MNSYELYHYGMPRRSGRYPWGSGTRPYQGLEGTPEYDDTKRKAIKSGTAKDVLAFQGDLTNQELQTALNRINMEQKLSHYAENEEILGVIDKIINRQSDNLTGWVRNGTIIYNMLATVYNSTKDGKRNPLPKI